MARQTQASLLLRARAPKRLGPERPTRARDARARGRKPSLDEQIEHLLPILRAALAGSRSADAGAPAEYLAPFYRALRASDIPFLPILHAAEPAVLRARASQALARLAGISPAVALAVENHLYVLSAIATSPALERRGLARRRQELLRRILRERWLLANTNSRVHGDKVSSIGTGARREGAGFRIDGAANFCSLASEGDLLVFLTRLEEVGALGIFVSPLKGNPEIRLGELLFQDVMAASDTRKVEFSGLSLGEDALLLVATDEQSAAILRFQLAWHQIYLGATFLGAAAQAIEEARAFLTTVNGPGGVPLASLDGMVIDVGRLVMRYRAARALLDESGGLLAAASGGAVDVASIADAFEAAGAAKCVACRTATEIVGSVRTIIGARSMAGNHPFARLSEEVLFGELAGEVTASIERHTGKRALALPSFHADRATRPRIEA